MVNGKGVIENEDDDDRALAACYLRAGGANLDFVHFKLWEQNTDGGQNDAFALQGVLTGFGGGDITIVCSSSGGGGSDQVDLSYLHLTAIKVAEVL